MNEVNLDEVTINGVVYVRKDQATLGQIKIGPEVIIRTYSAGVHIGTLAEPWTGEGETVVLTNARRIWRWRGANTLNEVATKGVNRSQYTRISEPVSSVTLVPIEVLPVASGLDFSAVWNG